MAIECFRKKVLGGEKDKTKDVKVVLPDGSERNISYNIACLGMRIAESINKHGHPGEQYSQTNRRISVKDE